MTPHLASLDSRKNGKTSIFSPSVHSNTAASIHSLAPSKGYELDQATTDLAGSWRSRRLIASIIGCEVGVFLAILSVISHGEFDPRQFLSRMAILSVALLGLSILRRKALPTESERVG